jgi:hypothetical protein
MTPFAAIRADHDRIRALFDRFEEASPRNHREKRSIFGEIRREIEAHQRLEEEILYPAAARAGLVTRAGESHPIVARLLGELDEIGVGHRRFDVVFAVLRENIEQHIREEERDVLGELERGLTAEEGEALRRAVDAWKENLRFVAP